MWNQYVKGGSGRAAYLEPPPIQIQPPYSYYLVLFQTCQSLFLIVNILISSNPNTAHIFISSRSLSNLSILIEPPPTQVQPLIVLKILHTIHAMAIHWFKEKLHHACVLESLRSSADRCARCRMIALRVVNLQWMWWVTRVYPEVKNWNWDFDIIVFWKNHLLLIFQHGSQTPDRLLFYSVTKRIENYK